MTHMILQLLLPLVATLFCYTLLNVVRFFYRDFTSPLRSMAGPKNPSYLFGNFKEITTDAWVTRKWQKQFGHTFQFRGLFLNRRLYTSDTTALNHVLNHSDMYQKPHDQPAQYSLTGNGLLAVEADDHRRQRKILNPAFGSSQIRQLTPVFTDKSIELRNIWSREIRPGTSSARIEVLSWLSKMTLDVIGQAGFNYHFNSLNGSGEPDELSEVLKRIFHSAGSARRLIFARAVAFRIPFLRFIPLPGRKEFQAARTKIAEIGSQLLAESRAALQSSKEVSGSRDLLSLILEANMSPDIPDYQKLSDAEAIGQIPTFFLAGHITTSTATAWALYALSMNRTLQTRLRQELFSLTTDTPTLDELNSLPLLENIIRETMRLYPPVVATRRKSTVDDVLPLGRPHTDIHGKVHNSLPIRKGQVIHIPILDVNTNESIWGEDAAEFKPERWEHVPDAASAIPSVWAHLLTFLAGPRNCIGFRFSIAEQKVLLFTLIRAFEFSPALPEGEIVMSSAGLQTPMVVSEKRKGSQLPLIVTAYTGA
ncbi:cytochrome P450 [Mycena rebaudengoi]|nr:cytochrome P450 [Mycena rebaudengoi]